MVLKNLNMLLNRTFSQVFVSQQLARLKPLFLIGLIIFSLFGVSREAFSQDIPIGTWKVHVPVSKCLKVLKDDRFIYGMNENSIIKYDGGDNSISQISTISGLDGVDLRSMAIYENDGTILIGYENGHLDIILKNEIKGYKDITRSSIIGSKAIN